MEGHAGTYIFIVLVAALKVIYMCCQMGIDNAEASVVENKPHCYTSFVSLKKKKKEYQMKKCAIHQKASYFYASSPDFNPKTKPSLP